MSSIDVISDMDIPAANVKQFSGSGIGGEF
jgi:hypothetical protein